MKVNFKSLNFKPNVKTKGKNNAINCAIKPYTINSNEILANYNKPLLFRGNNKDTEFPEIKELSDSEFKQYKTLLYKKANMNNLPDTERSILLSYITRANVFIIDRILSNKSFYTNPDFIKGSAFDILNSTYSIETAKINLNVRFLLLAKHYLLILTTVFRNGI